MRALPKALMDKPNDHPVLLDGSNVAHRLVGRSLYRSTCGQGGTPVTLAQAIAWSRAWCNHATCWTVGTTRGSR